MRHAEALAPGLFLRIHVNADDHCSAGEAKALDYVQADTAETKHNALGARFDFRRVDDGADAGGDAAADVAHLVERRVLPDFRHRDFGQDGEIRECRTAHIVVNFFTAG
jgi:hypothetical protein